MNRIKILINKMCTKLGLERPFDFFEDEYNPYCKRCDSCGETGCCSPVHCDMGKGCKYPETNLTDLRYNYTCYHRLLEYIHSRECYPEISTELDNIQDEEYDKWYSK